MRIFPFYLTGLTDFDCGLLRSLNMDTLILTTDIWSGAHGGRDRSAEDAYSSMAPDLTFAFVGGPWCPTLDFVIAFWIMIYVSYIVNFTILYYIADILTYTINKQINIIILNFIYVIQIV
jgi:hypothetical protein